MANKSVLRFPQDAAPLAAIGAAAIAKIEIDAAVDASLSGSTPPVLYLPTGEELRGAGTILRYFGRVAQREGFYGGSDPIAACQVDEVVDYAPTLGIGSEFERVCAYLNSYLAARTFFVSYDLSIADVAIYAGLFATGQRWDSIRRSPTAKYPNLIRWFNTVSAEAPDLAPSLLPFSRKAAQALASAAKKGPGAGEEAGKGGGKGKEEKGDGGGGAAGGAGGSTGGGGGGGDKPAELELPGAVYGQVVTRFPPEPSGFMHIGHAKAALMNQFFAEKYGGKMLVRFDDTNPSKEKDEFVESILADMARLGLTWDTITHTSDYFDGLIAMCEKLIREGKAYVDSTPKEQMREERMVGTESACRGHSIERNLELWAEMLKGSDVGKECCVRAKWDMQAVNKTLRDPVYFRVDASGLPHLRTGTKYKAYPTYDFACPYVDSIEGVTHALRSSEYHDRNEQYYRVLEDMGLRRVEVWDFSRLNFVYTLLSKRKLAWFVDNGRVTGWDDPRFPTVQGMLRRGLTVPALKQFILSQGASKNLNLMEMDKLWTINKKLIDPVCPRHTAILLAARVPLTLTNGPDTPFVRVLPRHKKHPPAGMKATVFSRRVWLERADARVIKENEEVTLMDWGNAIVQRKTMRAGGEGEGGAKEGGGEGEGEVEAMEGVLHLEGSVKTTKLKLTWLADSDELVPLTLVELDYLITKKKVGWWDGVVLDEGDDFLAALNPRTRWEEAAVGDANMRNLQRGDIIQLERKGYYICDQPLVRPHKPMVLIAIPDGRQRPPPGAAAAAAAK
ncbi:unnamed protein product [Closterium sp. Naga37s-1]|nr:unnamed protein product [Closterium sp. Naga37s-1]